MNNTHRKLLVMLTTGAEDGGKRATLALTAACTSEAMGTSTKLFLIGDGSHWAYDSRGDEVQISGFPPFAELMESFQELGGEVCICSACDQVCGVPETENGQMMRRSYIKPQGMSAVLSGLEGGQSITF